MIAHIIPIGGNEPAHLLGKCWCHPLQSGPLSIHHAKDVREKWERQGIANENKKWKIVYL